MVDIRPARQLVNGEPVKARDGVAVHGEDRIGIAALEEGEILIADVPGV